MTEQETWTARLMKPGFVTEAVAAVQIAAMQAGVELKAAPWEIAKAAASWMEDKNGR